MLEAFLSDKVIRTTFLVFLHQYLFLHQLLFFNDTCVVYNLLCVILCEWVCEQFLSFLGGGGGGARVQGPHKITADVLNTYGKLNTKNATCKELYVAAKAAYKTLTVMCTEAD